MAHRTTADTPRRLLAGLILALLLVGVGTDKAQAQPRFKSPILVQGSHVTLGDIMTETGAHANVIVARAPAAGTPMMLPVASVVPVVERAGLDWDKAAAPPYIMVERGTARPYLTLPTGPGKRAAAPAAPPPSDQPAGTIPVLKQPLARGETITRQAIEFIPEPQRLGGNVVTIVERVVGMAAKRALRAGEALRQSDLERPVLVRKGSLVSMETRRGPLSVTTVGKALANGAMGDIIPLANARSKRTIEARVIGPDRVSATPIGAPGAAGP